jgi:glycosyltransferase involved in cell wall biosynthesis
MIGVIIFSYNRRAHLQRCLESVQQCLAYTDIEYEIVVADDGSDDTTLTYLDKYHPEVKVSTHEHDILDISRSFNEALCKLHDDVDIVCTLQQDHIVFPMYFHWAKELVWPGRAVCGLTRYLHGDVSTDFVYRLHEEASGWWPEQPRWTLHYEGGGKTLIEMPDWRSVDGLDICLHRSDVQMYDREIRGQGHQYLDWVLRLRLAGVHFYTTPLMYLLHQHHDETRPEAQWRAELAESYAHMRRKWGKDIWHVRSTSDALVNEKTGRSTPLDIAALPELLGECTEYVTSAITARCVGG